MSRNTPHSTPVPISGPVKRVAKNLFSPVDCEGSSRGKKRTTPTNEISGSISEVATQLQKNARGASIPKAMGLLKCLPGVPVGSPMYWKGLRMIMNDRLRIAFLEMDSDEIRLEMVKEIGETVSRIG